MKKYLKICVFLSGSIHLNEPIRNESFLKISGKYLWNNKVEQFQCKSTYCKCSALFSQCKWSNPSYFTLFVGNGWKRRHWKCIFIARLLRILRLIHRSTFQTYIKMHFQILWIKLFIITSEFACATSGGLQCSIKQCLIMCSASSYTNCECVWQSGMALVNNITAHTSKYNRQQLRHWRGADRGGRY